MNKTELVEVVSSKAEISKAQAQKIVTATLDAIVAGVVSDGKVIRYHIDIEMPHPCFEAAMKNIERMKDK